MLQKSYFSFVVRPLPTPLSGRTTNGVTFFAAIFSSILHQKHKLQCVERSLLTLVNILCATLVQCTRVQNKDMLSNSNINLIREIHHAKQSHINKS